MNAVAKIETGNAVPQIAAIETEAALLGALMQESRFIDRAADRLRPEDFAEPLFGRIFDAIVREYSLGGRPTPITLRPLFADDPGMAQLGGPGFLAQLTSSGAGLLGVREFVAQIEDLAARRRAHTALIAAATDIAGLEVPLGQAVDRADAALVSALDRRTETRTVSGGQAAQNAIRRIEAIQAADGKVGARTGIAELDNLLGGLEPGQLVIIAGRPGMGKTAVASSAALGLASSGLGTLFVSLEMSADELGTRMLADRCCKGRGNWIEFSRIREATVDRSEIAKLVQAEREIDALPLVIDDRGSATLGSIVLSVRRQKRRMEAQGRKLSVVFVDYLQLVQPNDRTRSQYEAVSEVSRGLKALAKDLDVSVVALAQLSRAVEQRGDKRPMLSDLRDSGQIEQDADAVVFLYRDEYYLERAKAKRGTEEEHDEMLARSRGLITFICAKRRNGRTGDATAQYLTPYQAVRSRDWGGIDER